MPLLISLPRVFHPLVRTKTSRYRMLFTYFILLNIVNQILISSPRYQVYCYSAPPWPNITLPDNIDNLIADTDHEGSIFVAAGESIYRFSKDLKLMSSVKKTPILDQESESSSSQSDDLENKLLHLVKGGELVFSCWRAKDSHLQCWASKVKDLTRSSSLHWSGDIPGFKLNHLDSIRAFNRGSISSMEMIISSSRLTPVDDDENLNSSYVPYLPAIGRYEIVQVPEIKQLNLKLNTVLPYRTKLNNLNLLFDYVYIFNQNDYTHFILNDIEESPKKTDGQNNVRLARICNNDPELTSYTEISLTCNSHDNIYARTAHLELGDIDSSLHIVFETYKDHSRFTAKDSEETVLCSYSTKLIEDIFNKVTSDCNNGLISAPLLMKCHSNTTINPSCQPNPSPPEGWCTSLANPYIDGTIVQFNLKEDSYMKLGRMNEINFIHLSNHTGKGKFFIGTGSGFLSHMSRDGDFYYTANLNNQTIKTYEKFEKPKLEARGEVVSRYSVLGSNIVASTKDQVHLFDTNSCSHLDNCHDCMSLDSDCVFCGGVCMLEKECKSEIHKSCPPIIKEFLPKAGPITGNTKIHLIGDNFGWFKKGYINVTVDGRECRHGEYFDDELYCTIQPVSSPRSASIRVEVDDQSSHISRQGNTVAKDLFEFLEAKVFGLYPSRGPLTGGARTYIFGENINIGSNISIRLDDVPCKVTESHQDNVTCLLEPISIPNANGTDYSNVVTNRSLIFMIDGIKQKMEPRNSYKGYNLSLSYQFRGDLVNLSKNETVIVEGTTGDDGDSLWYWSLLIILVVTPFVLIYLFLQGKLRYLKKPNSPSSTKASPMFDRKEPGDILIELVEDEPLIYKYVDKEIIDELERENILISRQCLTLGRPLGRGQFGQVRVGIFKVKETGERVDVAVKTLHDRNSWDNPTEVIAFLNEGLVMKDFQHPNVLALIGVSIDSNGLPMVITPFMKYGDLKTYISDEASSPTVRELIDFGTQVARGMAYLSMLKFVHRDLAARNCMLDENMTVKIADFGLSRDIYERDYYSSDNREIKLPVKWMAIESLENRTYDTKTDVWSYGVLLWELMTRGVVPYPDVNNFDVFKYLKEGRRMLRPRYCPVILYKIMLSCWDENPANRPTFSELEIRVSNVISELKIAKDGQQKVSRDNTYGDGLK